VKFNFYNFLHNSDEIRSTSDKSRFLTVYLDLRKSNDFFLTKDKLFEVINYLISEKIPHLSVYIGEDLHPDLEYFLDLCKELPITLEFIFGFDSFNKNNEISSKLNFVSVSFSIDENTLLNLKTILENQNFINYTPPAFIFKVNHKTVSYLNGVLEFLDRSEIIKGAPDTMPSSIRITEGRAAFNKTL